MRSRKLAAVLAAGSLAGIALLAPPVLAGCHSFTVEASPERVSEGRRVTVTVTRDNDAAPSSVDVVVVEGTAKKDRDFRARERYPIAFAAGTSQSFRIRTVEDERAERAESFTLRLGNPSGCAVNPNYSLGPDAKVTIADDDEEDAAPAQTARPPDPTATATGAAASDEDGGAPVGLIVGIAALVAAAVAAALWFTRRKPAG